jgi:phosphoenolpyruvate carboxylase
MVQAKFGLASIAVRSLDVYTMAVIQATLTPPQPPK